MTEEIEKFCTRCALDSLYIYTEWSGSRLGGSHIHSTKKAFIKRKLVLIKTVEHSGQHVFADNAIAVYGCPECNLRYEFVVEAKK